jgi:hypothetical protein
MIQTFFLFFATLCLFNHSLVAKEISTNEVQITRAPQWLTTPRAQKIIDRIQHKLEWSTHKINVYWYDTQTAFDKVHSLGPMATAVTKSMGEISTVHMGPKVTSLNFDEIFGHEMVHVIVNQKYKGAIPKWLEEGLANHLARRGKVDYKWMSTQPYPDDVRQLAHPFSGSADGINYRYMASQAFAEMLHKKCDLDNLIRLSVQRKMEDYLVTFCEIKDLNKAFKDWVVKMASSANSKPKSSH